MSNGCSRVIQLSIAIHNECSSSTVLCRTSYNAVQTAASSGRRVCLFRTVAFAGQMILLDLVLVSGCSQIQRDKITLHLHSQSQPFCWPHSFGDVKSYCIVALASKQVSQNGSRSTKRKSYECALNEYEHRPPNTSGAFYN